MMHVYHVNMTKKLRRFFYLFSMLMSSAAAQSISGGRGFGGPGDALDGVISFFSEMFLIPPLNNPGEILMWVAGMGLTIYGSRIMVDNFDSNVGNWLPNTPRDYWIFGTLLALIFIGSANFFGFIKGLAWVIWIGIGLLFIAVTLRWFWFGGSALGSATTSVGNGIRTGMLGTIGRWIGDQASGAMANWRGPNNFVTQAWQSYKNMPRCDEPDSHLNPGASTGEDCWVDSCGGNIP